MDKVDVTRLSLAARLEAATDLLDAGMLCDCDNWQVVKAYYEEDQEDMDQEVLVHEKDCKGRQKLLELING